MRKMTKSNKTINAIKKDGLTLKERKFVQIYVETGNASEAVRQAYNVGSKGGSKSEEQKQQVIAQMTQALKRKPHIDNAIHKLILSHKLKKESILGRIDQIADKRRAYDRDKLRALELLGKHTGLFEENTSAPNHISISFGDVTISPKKLKNNYREVKGEVVESSYSLGEKR